MADESPKIVRSEIEWKQVLTPEQYEVLRMKGTEPPGSGEYYHEHGKGMYRCGACGNPLFSSDAKYDSGSGWPSFDAPVDSKNVILKQDLSGGMARTEVICANCGSHLGHMFNDGPKETTGARFCINSLSLKMDKDETK